MNEPVTIAVAPARKMDDYREALRPSTRLGPPGEEEFEEEG